MYEEVCVCVCADVSEVSYVCSLAFVLPEAVSLRFLADIKQFRALQMPSKCQAVKIHVAERYFNYSKQ